MKRVAAVVAAGWLFLPAGDATSAPKTKVNRVTVNCAAGDSLNATLSRLDRQGPNEVNVFGTCHENVYVRGFSDLLITGGNGATIVSAHAGPGTAALTFDASNLVVVEGLSVVAGEAEVALSFSACESCRIRGSQVVGGSRGVVVSRGSVGIEGCSITGARNHGVTVWSTDVAWLRNTVVDGQASDWPAYSALIVGGGSVVYVQDGTTLTGYAAGVEIFELSTVYLGAIATPPVSVRGNFYAGVRVLSASALFKAEHAVIAENGTVSPNGGVTLDAGAQAFLQDTDVRDNLGIGIRLRAKGILGLGPGATVAGNSIGGIVALNDSMVLGPQPWEANPPVTVSGNTANGGIDLVCDESSTILNADRITGESQTRSCLSIKGGE